MLVRDLRSGRLVAVPDHARAPQWNGGLGRYGQVSLPVSGGISGNVGGLGFYGAAPTRVIYDGLGNPVGILPFLAALAPLAAKAVAFLPAIAGKAAALLPMAGKAANMAAGLLPMLTGGGGGARAMPPVPMPEPPAMAPVAPLPPALAPVAPLSPGPAQSASVQAALPPAASHEEVIAPMRVRTPDGRTVVVPVRMRRRGRLRRRRIVRVAPLVQQVSRPPGVLAGPGFVTQQLQGYGAQLQGYGGGWKTW